MAHYLQTQYRNVVLRLLFSKALVLSNFVSAAPTLKFMLIFHRVLFETKLTYFLRHLLTFWFSFAVTTSMAAISLNSSN